MENAALLLDVSAEPMRKDRGTVVVDNDVGPLEALHLMNGRNRHAVLVRRRVQQSPEPVVKSLGVSVQAPQGDQASKAVGVRGTVAALVRGVKRRQSSIEANLCSDELDQFRRRGAFSELGDAFQIVDELGDLLRGGLVHPSGETRETVNGALFTHPLARPGR